MRRELYHDPNVSDELLLLAFYASDYAEWETFTADLGMVRDRPALGGAVEGDCHRRWYVRGWVYGHAEEMRLLIAGCQALSEASLDWIARPCAFTRHVLGDAR